MNNNFQIIKPIRQYFSHGQRFHLFFNILLLTFLCNFFNLYSIADLSIVGYVMPEDGLGKLPINILETLGDQVSANIIHTDFNPPLKQELPVHIKAALYNPDKTPGKIALFTEGLWHIGGKNAAHMPKSSIIKIAYSMFETTRIPNMWVKILNEEFDAVVVPDEFLVKVYQDSGVNIPIFVLPIPMILKSYYAHPTHPIYSSRPFVFGDASANKSPEILVESFARAFGNNSKVRLVMRAVYISPKTREIVDHIVSKYGLTNVILEDGHLSLQQYIERLSSFDCYINLSKGEGFSLIPREALALGIPCILSNNTASTTICNSGFVRAVPSNHVVPSMPIYNYLFNDQCGYQFSCKLEDVVDALLDVYQHYTKYIKKARRGLKWVNKYDYANPELQESYLTLIKPKQVILADKNHLEKGVIMTNSIDLYYKYEQIIQSNRK